MTKVLEECPECGSIRTHHKNAMEKKCSDCEHVFESEDSAADAISDALDGVVGA